MSLPPFFRAALLLLATLSITLPHANAQTAKGTSTAPTPAYKPEDLRTLDTPWGRVRTPVPTPGGGMKPLRVVPPPDDPLPSTGLNVLEVEMYVGETRVLPQPNAGRLAVGNGKVLSAAVLDDKEILLIANEIGVSSVHVWTKSGRNGRIKVTVAPGERDNTLRDIAHLLSAFPNVTTQIVGDRVIVDGKNLSDEQLFKLDMLKQTYPQIVNFSSYELKNGGLSEMVTMDVRIVQFNKTKLRELGIRWNQFMNGPAFGIAGDMQATRFSNGQHLLVNPPASANINNVDVLPRPIQPFASYFGIISILNSQINLYEREGYAVVLADPQLTARSGKAATFQVGGRIPYSVISTNGASSVQFESFGVMLKINPRVLKGGAILSDVSAEVSEPDPSITSSATLPGIRTRQAETTFNVQPGETMVLAGLIQRSSGETVDKIPGLGSIPILGEFFTSRRKELQESELVIFITPTIVTPQSAGQVERLERGKTIINGIERIESKNPVDNPPEKAAEKAAQ